MTSITDVERKAKKAAYDRAYKEKNRERLNALARERHRKNPEKERARRYKTYHENPEKERARRRELYWENVEQARAKGRAKSRSRRDFKTAYARARDERRRIGLIGRPIPTSCDICGGSDRQMCADHCHKLGHYRGWVCDRCNLVLGKVGDDRDLLRKMIAYLTQHAAYQSPQLTLPGF